MSESTSYDSDQTLERNFATYIFEHILSPEFCYSWWIDADFQSRLFVILFAWLIVNAILIHIAWYIYGHRVGDIFMKGRFFFSFII